MPIVKKKKKKLTNEQKLKAHQSWLDKLKVGDVVSDLGSIAAVVRRDKNSIYVLSQWGGPSFYPAKIDMNDFLDGVYILPLSKGKLAKEKKLHREMINKLRKFENLQSTVEKLSSYELRHIIEFLEETGLYPPPAKKRRKR